MYSNRSSNSRKIVDNDNWTDHHVKKILTRKIRYSGVKSKVLIDESHKTFIFKVFIKVSRLKEGSNSSQ